MQFSRRLPTICIKLPRHATYSDHIIMYPHTYPHNIEQPHTHTCIYAGGRCQLAGGAGREQGRIPDTTMHQNTTQHKTITT